MKNLRRASSKKQNNVEDHYRGRVERMLKALGDWDVSVPQVLFLEGGRYRRMQLDQYDQDYQLKQPE